LISEGTQYINLEHQIVARYQLLSVFSLKLKDAIKL